MAASKKKLAKRSYLSFAVIVGVAVVALAAVYLLLGKNSPSQDLQSKAAVTGLNIPNGVWEFNCEGGTSGCSETKWSAGTGSTVTYNTAAGDINFKVGKTGASITNHSSINMPSGAKKMKISFTAPEGVDTTKFAYQWKVSGDDEWKSTKKKFGTDSFELSFSNKGKYVITGQRIVFTGAAVDTEIALHSVVWTVDTFIGEVTKQGTMYKKDGKTFLNENKKSFELRSMPTMSQLQDWITNKQKVKVTGSLGYDDLKTPYITVKKIEATQEEIPMAADFKLSNWIDYGKATDPELTTREEEGGTTMTFSVGDQAEGKETTPATGGVMVTGLNMKLGKAAKRLSMNVSLHVPEGVTPKFNLYLLEKGKSWAKKALTLDTSTDEAMQYDIPLTGNAVTLDGIKFEVTGAQWIDSETKGVTVDINSLNVMMVKPAGTVYKEGTYNKTNKTVNVKGEKLYYINATPALGDADLAGNPLDDKMPVRVLGTLSYNDPTNPGKPVIAVNNTSGSVSYVQAMVEWVAAPMYTFDEGTEGWATDTEGATVKQENGSLKYTEMSGKTESVYRKLDEEVFLRTGAKTATVVLTAGLPSQETAAKKASFSMYINGKKYPLKDVDVTVAGAEPITYKKVIDLGKSPLTVKELKLSFEGVPAGTTVLVDQVGISTLMGTGSVTKTGTITAKESAYANFRVVTKKGSCTLSEAVYQIVPDTTNADSQTAFAALTKGSRYTVVGVFSPETTIPGVTGKYSPIMLTSADQVLGSDPKTDASCGKGDESSGDSCTSKPGCYWKKDGYTSECLQYDAAHNCISRSPAKEKTICVCP